MRSLISCRRLLSHSRVVLSLARGTSLRLSRSLSSGVTEAVSSPPPVSAGGDETAEESDDANVDSLRDKILDRALHHVRSDGWSREAIAAAVEELKLLPVTQGLVSGGAIDLVYFAMDSATAHASSKLGDANLSAMDVNERIVFGVRSRLEFLAPYRLHWAQAMALGALPQHLPGTLERLTSCADEIWWRAGDASVDMHWYTRRALLVSVIVASEAFMLTDTSQGHEDTWAFVARRVADVSSFGQGAGGALSVLQASANGVGSILGAAVSLIAPLPASVLKDCGGSAAGRAPRPSLSDVVGQLQRAPPLQHLGEVLQVGPQGLAGATQQGGAGEAISNLLRSAVPTVIPGSGGVVDSLATAVLPPALANAGGAVARGLFGSVPLSPKQHSSARSVAPPAPGAPGDATAKAPSAQ